MSITAIVNKPLKGKPGLLEIEGPVEVDGSQISASPGRGLGDWLNMHHDQPVYLKTEPGGFPIALRDETAPGGVRLVFEATVPPPVRLKVREDPQSFDSIN